MTAPRTTVTRRLEFDAAHRVPRHESKCRSLHGHRYVVEVTATAPGLDTAGRIVDFGVVKELVGGWLDREWDHTTILDGTLDAPLADFIEAHQNPGRPVVRLAGPPTAEVMARVILARAQELLAPCGVTVTRVRVYETPNCYADAEVP